MCEEINYMKKNINIFKKSILYNLLIIIFFIFLTFILNRLQSGSVIATGDFHQSFNLIEHYQRYFYMWNNKIGQGTYNTMSSTGLYYFILMILEKISYLFNISNSNFIQFLFLLLSFYSARYFVRTFFILNNLENLIFSFFYALNPVTFNILSFSWGYTHHVLYYIFLPALLASFYKVISFKINFKIRLAKFSILQLVAIMIINNIAFAAILLGFYFIVFLISSFYKKILINIKQFIFLIASMFFSFYWYFILNAYYLSSLSNKLASNKVIGKIDDWLKNTSSTFQNIFSMSHDISALSTFNPIFIISFLLPTLVLLVLFFSKKERGSILPLFLLLFVIGVAVRVYGVFGQINLFFYQLPGVNILRSPDKIIFSLPIIFLYCIIFYYKLSNFRHKNYLIVFILLPSIVFIFGITSKVLENKAFGSGGYYSKVISVPGAYKNISSYINTTKNSSVIISLPYSVSTSINWSNYPKWNFVGHDITHMLYKKNLITSNSFDNPSLENQMSFKLDEFPLKGDKDLLERLQRFGVEHIFVHKDIDPIWMKDSQMYSDMLASSTYAKIVDSNDYFDLYKIKDEFITSHILSNSNLTFQKTNPTHYTVWIKNISTSTNLEFLESNHPSWDLYAHKYEQECTNAVFNYVTSSTTECLAKNKFWSDIELYIPFRKSLQLAENTHIMVKGYANGWTMDVDEIKKLGKEYYKQNEDGTIDVKIDLYFKPQSYYVYGLFISIFVFIVAFSYLCYYGYNIKKTRQIK